MSGAQTSAFPDQNILYNNASGLTTAHVLQNQLANQGAQQELNAAEMEQLSRASNWIISQDPENKDPGKQAQAYSTAVRLLRANGYAKQAPDVYPGFEHMQFMSRQGTPSAEQFKFQQSQQALDAVYPGGGGGRGATAPSAPSAPGTVAAPGTIEPEAVSRANAVRDGLMKRGMDYDTATAFAANALHESAANPNTGAGDAGASHGLFQWRGDRYDRYVAKYGHSPDNAPLDEQLDYVLDELNGPESLAKGRIAQAQGPEGKAGEVSQAFLRPKDVAAEMARRSATAKQLAALGPAPATPGMTDQQWLQNQGRQYPSLASAGAGTPGQVPAAPGGGVVARNPGAVQFAGPGAGASPAAPTADLMGPRPLPPTGYGQPEVTPQQIANTPAPQNALAPPAPLPPSAQAQAPAPAAVAPPPPPQAAPGPQLDADNLTPQDHQALARLKAGLATSRNPQGPQLLQAEIDRRATANVAAQHYAAQQQQQAVTAAREAEQLRLSQETQRLAQEKAAREAAAADPLQQSKSDMADAERVLRALAPKIRAGQELTTDEADRYDIARRAYARGPLQANVPDGKGGTMTAYVGQEVSDRFPPLPGQKEYAGIKPVPGTEKQPDIAPQPVVAGMLLSSTGQQKIATALASLEAHPASVGPTALQPNWMSQRTDPAGVKVRADIGDVAGHILHDMAGTAQSASEAKRLEPFVPTATDTADAIKVKLRRMLDINRETMLQNYRTYGPESNFRRVPVIEEAILGSIPEAAMEHLKKEPNTVKQFDQIYGKGAGKLVLANG